MFKATLLLLASVLIVGCSDSSGQSGPDILLVHGFSIAGGDEFSTENTGVSLFSGTNCANTWAGQAETLASAFPKRNVVSIGFYSDDQDCDVALPGAEDNSVSTSIEELSLEFYQYIYNEYTLKSKSVDIVAHSMGGIIARKMLADWGSQVNVPRVVTLGTPHEGHSWTFAILGCPTSDFGNLTQCYEMSEGSPFMESLENNPQSAVSTQWTLVSTTTDGVIGGAISDTGTAMDDGNDASAPAVNKITYSAMDYIASEGSKYIGQPIGHSSLVGETANRDFYALPAFDAIDNPTTIVMNALNAN